MLCEENDLKQMIHEQEERSFSGRLERLRFLLSICKQCPFPSPCLAYEYYEEARLCWYAGAFVATILMVELSFEELIRSHYRLAKGVSGNLNSGKKIDDAGFADLINEARDDFYISDDEANSLHHLRKNLRNPWVHVKDVKLNRDGKINLEKPSFSLQEIKISAPELLGSGVETEAKEAIRLLITLFPEISVRHLGL